MTDSGEHIEDHQAGAAPFIWTATPARLSFFEGENDATRCFPLWPSPLSGETMSPNSPAHQLLRELGNIASEATEKVLDQAELGAALAGNRLPKRLGQRLGWAALTPFVATVSLIPAIHGTPRETLAGGMTAALGTYHEFGDGAECSALALFDVLADAPEQQEFTAADVVERFAHITSLSEKSSWLKWLEDTDMTPDKQHTYFSGAIKRLTEHRSAPGPFDVLRYRDRWFTLQHAGELAIQVTPLRPLFATGPAEKGDVMLTVTGEADIDATPDGFTHTTYDEPQFKTEVHLSNPQMPEPANGALIFKNTELEVQLRPDHEVVSRDGQQLILRQLT